MSLYLCGTLLAGVILVNWGFTKAVDAEIEEQRRLAPKLIFENSRIPTKNKDDDSQADQISGSGIWGASSGRFTAVTPSGRL